MKLTASELSRELRESSDEFLGHRRCGATLMFLGMTSLAGVALYQLGIFSRLPEPPLPGFDTERVNGSAEAYKIFNLPDAFLGLGSYAATLGLIAMGGAERATTQPWIPLALAAKSGFDVIQSADLTRDSWVKHRAFSIYSLVAALAAWLAFPTVVPEALAALRKLRSEF